MPKKSDFQEVPSISKTEEIRFWLVRHAPVAVNYIYGQQDLSAELADMTAFHWLYRQLPQSFNAYTSDLTRCRETLDQLKKIGSEVVLTRVSKELREQSFGHWEGLSYEQARLENAKAYAKFWENPVENAPPAGESFAEVCQRVGEFFNLVVRENTNDDVVFIVHAGTIRAILAQALQLEPAQSQLLDITPLSLSRITLYRHEGALSWKIDFINSTAAY